MKGLLDLLMESWTELCYKWYILPLPEGIWWYKKPSFTGIFILKEKTFTVHHDCTALLNTYGGLLVQMFVWKEITDQIEVALLKTIKLFSWGLFKMEWRKWSILFSHKIQICLNVLVYNPPSISSLCHQSLQDGMNRCVTKPYCEWYWIPACCPGSRLHEVQNEYPMTLTSMCNSMSQGTQWQHQIKQFLPLTTSFHFSVLILLWSFYPFALSWQKPNGYLGNVNILVNTTVKFMYLLFILVNTTVTLNPCFFRICFFNQDQFRWLQLFWQNEGHFKV